MVDKKDTIRTLVTANDPELTRSFRGHKGTITALSFNPNMKQIASAAQDNTVTVWNFKTQQRPFKFVGHKGPVNDVSFSPNGALIASASQDTTVKLWQNSVDAQSVTLKAHNAAVRSVNFSCDGKWLLTSSDDKTAKVWNTADRKFVFSLTGHSNWVRSSQFSPDVRLIATGSDDKSVKLWDVEHKQEIHSFTDHTGMVNSVKFHPDGTCVASCSRDKKIKIWDIRSKRLLQHYDAHSDNINQISFHPSGNYLISASDDARLKIWDLRQGRLAFTLYGHEGGCTASTFSAGGDYFATGGSDNIVMVWKSNFEEQANEYIEEVVDASKTGSVSTNRIQSNKRAPSDKENKPEPTSTYNFTGTFSQTKKSAAPEVSKTDKVLFSTKDKSFHSMREGRDEPLRETKTVTFQDPSQIDMNVLPEAVTSTLDKVFDQLQIISKTLQVLEMRLGVNEEQISHLSHVVSTNRPIAPADSKEQFAGSFRIGSENVFSQNALQQSTSFVPPQQGFEEVSKVSFPPGTKF